MLKKMIIKLQRKIATYLITGQNDSVFDEMFNFLDENAKFIV